MEVIIIDCRLLEPPEPMLLVLEAVSKLKKGQKIQMLHRMKPTPLFAKLEERGMSFRLEEQSGQFTIWIQHKEGQCTKE